MMIAIFGNPRAKMKRSASCREHAKVSTRGWNKTLLFGQYSPGRNCRRLELSLNGEASNTEGDCAVTHAARRLVRLGPQNPAGGHDRYGGEPTGSA